MSLSLRAWPPLPTSLGTSPCLFSRPSFPVPSHTHLDPHFPPCLEFSPPGSESPPLARSPTSPPQCHRLPALCPWQLLLPLSAGRPRAGPRCTGAGGLPQEEARRRRHPLDGRLGHIRHAGHQGQGGRSVEAVGESVFFSRFLGRRERKKKVAESAPGARPCPASAYAYASYIWSDSRLPPSHHPLSLLPAPFWFPFPSRKSLSPFGHTATPQVRAAEESWSSSVVAAARDEAAFGHTELALARLQVCVFRGPRAPAPFCLPAAL